MHRIPIRTIMTRDVITIHPEELVPDAAQLMSDLELRRLPVIDEDGCLIGIVTDSDVTEAETADFVRSNYEPDADQKWLTVADVMSRDVVTIDPDSTVGQLAQLLMKHKIGGVPVVAADEAMCNRKRLIGIVTETDLFKMIAAAWEQEGATANQ